MDATADDWRALPSCDTAATFARCSFCGTYDGIKFGIGESNVQKCDFSAAHLVDCDFQNCDIAEQRFCGWPQVSAQSVRGLSMTSPRGRAVVRPRRRAKNAASRSTATK
jgi:hypothetical protein